MIQRAYKTKLRPTAKQAMYFYGCAGVARYVYNWALADRKRMFEEGGKPNKFEQKKRFNAWKKEQAPWLAEYPYVVVERAFDDLDTAYQNFFRRIKQGTEKAGFPKFKSRHTSRKSFCLGNGGVHIEPDRIKLPRIGWVKLAERNYLPCDNAKLNRVTLSERCGAWYISAQMEVDDLESARLEGSIGIDLGVKALATVSDGATFDNPVTLKKYERKMARLQRELSRRKKGGSNRAKTKAKIAKLHGKIGNTRAHTLHNISHHVTYDILPERIVIEDLNVKGMLKNGRLSKAISDASMGEMRRQIEYKAEWIGADVCVADRWYPSSKTCSQCGCVQPMPLSERIYHCPDCGAVIDRDLNAAINLAQYKE
jgi:putative transposase